MKSRNYIYSVGMMSGGSQSTPHAASGSRIIAVFGIDLGCPIIESRSRAHDTVSLDAHPCHETEALIFPKLFRVCRPVVN